jgi:hypothetical protein
MPPTLPALAAHRGDTNFGALQDFADLAAVLVAVDGAPVRVARGDRARLRPSPLAALRGALDQGAGSR